MPLPTEFRVNSNAPVCCTQDQSACMTQHMPVACRAHANIRNIRNIHFLPNTAAMRSHSPFISHSLCSFQYFLSLPSKSASRFSAAYFFLPSFEVTWVYTSHIHKQSKLHCIEKHAPHQSRGGIACETALWKVQQPCAHHHLQATSASHSNLAPPSAKVTSHNSQSTSHKLQVTSYNLTLQVTTYIAQVTS